MIFIDNANITDPRVNLAIEEHFLRNFYVTEDLLLFYVNEPSIIIGRNQNALEEINLDYVQKNEIQVVRRLSGGGAVYHDLGNLNFSFITDNGREYINNYKYATAPIIKSLHLMGVRAELGQRSDIVVDGRKISGNAQYLTGKRLLGHGTLLFNSDLSKVTEALQVKKNGISSKGIRSVRCRVANITEFLSQPMHMDSFRLHLLKSIAKDSKQLKIYRLSDSDWEEIQKIKRDRYNTWEWNYGRSPDFNLHRIKRFASGEIEIRINVKSGFISEINFTGNFVRTTDMSELEEHLKGIRYEKYQLLQALEDLDISTYFHDMSRDELVRFIY
jgi:lipoate-protein ligase A